MSARPLTGTDQHCVEGARRLLSDLKGIDWATVTDADLAFLVGRAGVVIASLIVTVEGGER
ncbi:hypothetical protein [Streptomyces sp. NRRL F-5135]|uniref:hypothetical protein n=1 Tax=Streptomyces sp. NRRL F-5135 TaxID=1463858 RepID=UPI0004C89929|nr:hypothetical protein [Streptomyces sp. NRRL F-5135]